MSRSAHPIPAHPLLAIVACAAGVLLASPLDGCGGVEQGTTTLKTPDLGQFPQVEDALAASCATLDCHGQVGRNLRMYWSRGLRLSAEARPGEGETTTEEYQATYRSLVALEPYKLDAVVAGSVAAESLTVVRKGRGVEAHKGGSALRIGSDADRCLVTWLANATDSVACKRAVGK